MNLRLQKDVINARLDDAMKKLADIKEQASTIVDDGDAAIEASTKVQSLISNLVGTYGKVEIFIAMQNL